MDVGGARGPVMSRQIVYRLNVWAKQPLAESADHADYPTLEHAATAEAKREIERRIIACLRRFELDSDVELMDFSVEDED